MERNKSEKQLVQVLVEGEFYLEWSEVCQVVGLARTTLLRTIDKFDLLGPSDVVQYKNRNLIRKDWAFGFWKEVSKKTLANK
ncbi:MAG TPA: hypothetical protein VL021_04180 [Brumimicrobium sp.]|nr:hypothetical protein [Brumimicrobium sp.]